MTTTMVLDPPAIVQTADDLAALAAAINSEHEAVAGAIRKGVEHARAAGELLLRAKKECGHGDWLPWLEKNCPDIGARQVQKYMRLARQLPANTNCDSHLTIDEALSAVADLRIGCREDLLRLWAEARSDEYEHIEKFGKATGTKWPRCLLLIEAMVLFEECKSILRCDRGAARPGVVKALCKSAKYALRLARELNIDPLPSLSDTLYILAGRERIGEAK